MVDEDSKSEAMLSWEKLAASTPPKLPKTTEAIGKRCAKDGCDSTKGISYEKPICWTHWRDFDSLLIDECSRCHWFDEVFYEDTTSAGLCYECLSRERQKAPPASIYAHGPVERRVRYLYILKMDGGKWYVGQTNSLELRLQEHLEGNTPSTRGRHPRLVWFEEWIGEYKGLIEREAELTRLTVNNPRVIRRIVEQWQKPHRLVNWDTLAIG